MIGSGSFVTTLASGNNRLFAEIMHTYSSKLFSIAFYITKSKPVSEDIVQEAFLKLWQKREEIVPDNLGGWLHRVVSNSAYDHLKRESKKREVLYFLQAGKNETYTEVEERLMRKEEVIFFDRAYKKLPARQQMVYQLSQKKGLSRNEIASHMNISPNTVKVHLLKAVRFIKEHVAGACLFFIFFVFNNLFFHQANTIDGPSSFNNVEHTINKKLPEKMTNKFLYVSSSLMINNYLK